MSAAATVRECATEGCSATWEAAPRSRRVRCDDCKAERKRERDRERQRRRREDPKVRAREAEYRRDRYREDPDFRARQVAHDRRYREDPKVRAREAEYQRRRREDPKVRAREAEYQRRRREDPELRAREAEKARDRDRAADRVRLRARTDEEILADRARLRPYGMKRCRRCREALPLEAFSATRTRADGLRDSCRPCDRAAVRARALAPWLGDWERRDTWTCVYCAEPYEHADHVHPKALGGSDHAANLVPACAACNLSKNDRPLFDWRPDLATIMADWPVEYRELPPVE